MTSSGFGLRPRKAERARIEAAVLDVVLERGYGAATLAEVCRRAGLDQERFTRHFDDLLDAYCVMIEAERNEFLRCAGTGFLSGSDWRSGIRAAAYSMIDYLASDLRRSRFVFVEILSAPDRAQLIRDQGMELLFDLIDLGRSELADPDSISRTTAVAIGGSIYNQLQLAVAGETISEALVPRLLYSVVLPYAGPAAAEQELSMPRPRQALPGPPQTTLR